jgi:hypothetical protein
MFMRLLEPDSKDNYRAIRPRSGCRQVSEGGDNAVDSAPTTIHEALKGALSSERQTLDDLEWIFNPYIQGWIDY